MLNQTARFVSQLLGRLTKAPESSEQLQRVASNTGLLLGSRLASMPLGVLQSILVARLLGVEGFGVLAIIVTYVAVLNQLTSFRMNEFVVRYGSEALAADDRSRAAAIVKGALLVEAGASLTSFLIIATTSGIAAQWFIGDPGGARAIRLYALLVVGNAIVETSRGILQLANRFRPQAIADFSIRLLTLLGTIVALLLGKGLLAVLLAMVLGNALPACGLAVAASHLLSQRLGRRWWKAPLREMRDHIPEMRSFVLSTNISTSLSLVIKDGDALWIGFLANPTQVGYYRLASMLVKFVFLPGNPLTQAVYPELAHSLADRKPKRAADLMRQSSLLAAAWVVPLGLLLAVLAPWILRKFYGPAFLPAYPSLLLLLVGMGIAHVLFWTRPALLSLGRHRFTLLVAMINAVLKVPATLLVVPRLGQVGMASVTSTLFVLGSVVPLLAVKRQVASLLRTEREQGVLQPPKKDAPIE